MAEEPTTFTPDSDDMDELERSMFLVVWQYLAATDPMECIKFRMEWDRYRLSKLRNG